ncbi:MAG: hypothetical protein JNM94_04950 [Phycisphaerae bacterium]|nr:hypothetical protein [Phycisphaerae bacterium]
MPTADPSLTSARESAARRPDGTVRVLKESPDAGVYLARGEGGDAALVVAKRWRRTAWEWCKSLLGIAQPQRQLRNAHRLLRASIATPAPIGGLRTVRGAGVVWFEIRLRWVEGEPLLERVRRADASELARLGVAMRAILRQFAEAGLFNRDAKLSNWIVTPEGAIVAIDPVGVRSRRDPVREHERLAWSLACELTQGERDRAQPFLAAALESSA